MKIHNFFSPFRKPASDPVPDDTSPELEQLTNKLLAEAKADLQKVFIQQMEKREKPLGTDDAKTILEVLIKETVAKRKLLIGRLEKDLEEGRLYRRYFQKMDIINDLTSDSHIKAKVMTALENDYVTQAKILNNITKSVYTDNALNNKNPFNRDNTEIAVDINEEMQLQKLSIISRDMPRKTSLELEWEESDDSVITASSADQDFKASVMSEDSKASTEPNDGGQGNGKQDNSEGSGTGSVQHDEERTDDGGEVIG